MAIRNMLSRQGRAATLRPRRVEDVISTPVMRRAAPPPTRSRQKPESPRQEPESPRRPGVASPMPSELFNSDGTGSGGDPGSRAMTEGAPEGTGIDPAVQEATAPDIGGFMGGRLASGVKTGVMARAMGAPTGTSLKIGVRSAFNPTGVMLAAADTLAPGLIAQAPTQSRFEGATSRVDPKGKIGVRDTFNALAETKRAREQGWKGINEEALQGLREMGPERYNEVRRTLGPAKMASQPFSTQIADYVGDVVEKGAKRMVGISEKEDLDRMIADDPAASLAMREQTRSYDRENAFTNPVQTNPVQNEPVMSRSRGGGNGPSGASMGFGPTGEATGAEAGHVASAGMGYGRDFGGRDGRGGSRGRDSGGYDASGRGGGIGNGPGGVGSIM